SCLRMLYVQNPCPGTDFPPAPTSASRICCRVTSPSRKALSRVAGMRSMIQYMGSRAYRQRCPDPAQLLGFLRRDLHASTNRHEFPYLLDLRIGHGNATVCPIVFAVPGAHPGVLRHESVNHDVSAGRDAELVRALPVGGVGIRNAQGKMKLAVGV